MRSMADIDSVATTLLDSQGLRLVSYKILQSLWAGYGHICHIRAKSPDSPTVQSFILKCISPPESDLERPPDEGRLRKILSYQIEQHFYTHLVPLMPKNIGIASCLASMGSSPDDKSGATAMIMSDLRESFPVAGEKRAELSTAQTYAALDWLASFHGFWWTRTQHLNREELCRPPLEHYAEHRNTVLKYGGVWLNGGYTYLATRRSEYDSLKYSKRDEWSSKLCEPVSDDGGSIGELIALFLSPSGDLTKPSTISEYTTLLHGDVKSENLFTSLDGHSAAFFDFQYVGLGLGVCDLAKFFTCSVSRQQLGEEAFGSDGLGMSSGEEKLLRFYLDKLQTVSGKTYDWELFVLHWQTSLVDWLRFQASWGFWGNTEWLEGRARSILQDNTWRAFIEKNTR